MGVGTTGATGRRLIATCRSTTSTATVSFRTYAIAARLTPALLTGRRGRLLASGRTRRPRTRRNCGRRLTRRPTSSRVTYIVSFLSSPASLSLGTALTGQGQAASVVSATASRSLACLVRVTAASSSAYGRYCLRT